MKFGTKVLVTRGSAGIKSGPGVLRTVKATLIGAYGDTRIVRLDQNSSSTTVEKPSYKYTVIVTHGMPNGGEMADKYLTNVFMTTDSGIRFTTTEGKSVYASNYVVYEN